MADINWTDSQKCAIDIKADKILVSAAAGSGKSSVLVQRIITSIIKDHGDISKKLIVTFTRAAAEELKLKIESAVRKEVLENPDNHSLSEQLLKLPSASIGTIHGICFSLIRENFQRLGLPAALRVADENEIVSLKLEVLEKLINDAYLGLLPNVSDFASFAENYITERDDKLIKIFSDIYDKIKNLPNGFDDWKNQAKSLENSSDVSTSAYGDILFNYVLIVCDFLQNAYQKVFAFLDRDAPYKASFFNAYSDDYSFITKLRELAVEGSYQKIRAHLQTFAKTSLNRMNKNDKTEEGEFYREIRVYYTKNIEKLKNKLFCYSDDENRFFAQKCGQYGYRITEFLHEYDKAFSEEKLKRSILDFNDIEHYALKLLYDENGELSPSAYALSEKYDEIYVDEYQDVNPLQNKIFSALSVRCPIFMVGDIKQSIYNFRGAVPEIFSNYRRSFTKAEKPGLQYENVAVFLSDNFRSLSTVTEFSNTVSDALFSSPENDPCYNYRIPYSKIDRLNCTRKEETAKNVELLICSPDQSNDESDKSENNEGNFALESEMIANKILSLIQSGVPEKEIAVLLRSPKKSASDFEKRLKERGISVSSEKGAKLFEEPEIQLVLCILNCIDNPYRDIFLAGALRSPIFGFSLDELIKIRRAYPDKSSLYDALCLYTDDHDLDKGRYFLDIIDKLRSLQINTSLDKLLWSLYTLTSFFTVIYDGGTISQASAKSRRANLLSLHKLAKQYSSSGRNGLYEFLERIRILNENDKSPTSASDNSDGVRIMSIHSSKGLEFSHCFLCGTNHPINKKDLSADIISTTDLGIAQKIRDNNNLCSSDNVYRLALSTAVQLQQVDEEMRMLYVALTRAKNALYISADIKDFEKFDTTCRYNAIIEHPFTYIRDNTYIKWILTALRRNTDLCPRYDISIISENEIKEESALALELNTNLSRPKLHSDEEKKQVYSTLKSRFTFEYPYKHSVNLPSKLSVSKLSPSILDNSEYLGGGDETDIKEFIFDRTSPLLQDTAGSNTLDIPVFLTNENQISGADKGTATHIFMQFCDFDNILKNGIDNEIARLKDSKFILSAHAELINKKAIQRFMQSDIFKEIRAAENIEREYRFNIKLPADKFTQKEKLKNELENESVFVQGVIDCYFYDKDKNITLLDYKTDAVPLKIAGDKEQEDNFFKKRYLLQLSYYNDALTKLCSSPVTRILLYSFSLGRCIDFTNNIIKTD